MVTFSQLVQEVIGIDWASGWETLDLNVFLTSKC